MAIAILCASTTTAFANATVDLESERSFIQEIRKYLYQHHILSDELVEGEVDSDNIEWNQLSRDQSEYVLNHATLNGKVHPVRFLIAVDEKNIQKWNLYVEEKENKSWVRKYKGSPIGYVVYDELSPEGKFTAFITENNIESVLTKLKIPYNTFNAMELSDASSIAPYSKSYIEQQKNAQVQADLKKSQALYQSIGDKCYATVRGSDILSKRLVHKIFPAPQEKFPYSEGDLEVYEDFVEKKSHDVLPLLNLKDQTLDLSLRMSILNLISFSETYISSGLATVEDYFSSVWRFEDQTIHNSKYKQTYKEMVPLYKLVVGNSPIRKSKETIIAELKEFNLLTAKSRNICERANKRFKNFIASEYMPIERSNADIQDSQFKSKYMGSYETEMQNVLIKVRESKIGSIFLASEEVRDELDSYDSVDCFRDGDALSDLQYEDIEDGIKEIEKNLVDQIDETVADQNEDSRKVLKKYIINYPQTVQSIISQNLNNEQMYCACGLIEEIYDEDQFNMFRSVALMAVPVLGEYLATAKIIGTMRVMYNAGFMAYSAMDYYKGYRTEKELSMAWASGQANTAYAQQELAAADKQQTHAVWNFAISTVTTAASIKGAMNTTKVQAPAKVSSDPMLDEAKQMMDRYKEILSGAENSPSIRVQLEILLEKMKKNPHIQFNSNQPILASTEIFPGPTGVAGVNLNRPRPQGGIPINSSVSKITPTPKHPQGGLQLKTGSGTQSQTLVDTKVVTANEIIKPTLVPQTKPMAVAELDPNVVPMPVHPDVVIPPVLPAVVESPEGHASAAEKVKQDHAQQQKNHQKLAETVIENDLNETNVDVIEAIQVIAKGQGDFARKARDWLDKHGAQVNYTHSSHANEQMRRNKKMRMEIEKDFLGVDGLNDRMISLLKKRNETLEKLIQANIVTDEKAIKLFRENLLVRIKDNLNNDLVQTFHQLSQEVHEKNKELVRALAVVVQKYGFETNKIESSDGMFELKIIPTSETKFYQTVIKYSQNIVEDPLNYFTFLFNPVELHIQSAAASVGGSDVQFGLSTVKNILLNELLTTELHEIRHLYFELLRINKVPSLFHQAYQFKNGSLNKTKTYEHFASAEEIAAYGNDLKEEVALIRNILDSTRRSSVIPKEDAIDFEEIDSIVETLFHLNIGFLHTSEKFMRAINERSYASIEDDSTKSSYTSLATGEVLRTDFISPEQRKIFGNYIEDRELNESPFLEHIYNEQLKLNHLAYNQIILLVGLSRAIADYNAVDQAIESMMEDFVVANQDALISEIEEKTNDLRNRSNLNAKIEDILGLSLRIYQIGKENSSYFNTLAQKQDVGHWKHVVTERFNWTGKPKDPPSSNSKPNQWSNENKSSSSEKKTGKSEEDEILSLGSPYGDTKFLDQLKFHVVDINDKGRNDVDAFFRGLVSFYTDAGVDQYELKTYTTWLVKNFNFVPFWGRNEHGVDWGYSTMQMWHKGSNLQFDVTFFVDDKNKPFVFIKAPLNNQEVMYDFHFIVTGLEKYVGPNGLIQPYQEDLSKDFFYFATGAQYPETKPTHWFKEKSDDFPVHPSHDVPTQVPNQNLPIEHVHYHEQKIVSLSRDSSVENALFEKLKSENINLESIKKLPYADSRERSSTRILKLGDETYYVKFYEDKHDPKSPGYQSIQQHEQNKKYRLTDLEYAIYLVDQHLTQRYADSFLFEIDGEKVFLSKRLNLIAFNYVDFLGNRYNQISYDEMARLYLMNHPTSQGPVNYTMPGEVILFDLLTGNSDRNLTQNVNLVGNATLNYRENSKPLELAVQQYEVMIFDGGLSFATDASAKVKDANIFWNWYEEYFYNDLLNKDQEPRSVVKKLIKDNPAFIQKLLAWNAEQIKTDLPNLSEEHFAQFLKNRQFILDLASEETNPVELEIQKIKSLTKENWLNQVKSQVNYLGSGYTGVVLEVDENTVLKINHRMIEKNNPIDLADQVKALKILKEAGYRAIAPLSEIKIGNFADGAQFAYVQFTKVVGKELDYALASSGLFGEGYRTTVEKIQSLFIAPAKQKLAENGLSLDENHIFQDIYFEGDLVELKNIVSSGDQRLIEEFFRNHLVWIDPAYSAHNSRFN